MFLQKRQQGKRVADHGQALCNGGWPRPHPPARVATHGQPPCRAGHLRPGRLGPRPPLRGRPTMAKAPCRGSRQHARSPVVMASAYRAAPAAKPQGAVALYEAARGSLMARATACKGGSTHARQHHPPARCRPRAAAPVVGAAAHADGVQHRRLRKAAAVTQ
ncbi:hypothetical protein B296_00006174 [Ensete ventricosum]|uniref:Uncharacterized protein n=1 Tax=Ensete ventricosum TaxID=4639 RepID=A0A426YLW7_ENSVE|nr:hypothetical protein B296_00006174 [Ensete ventricosum]